MPSKKRLYQDDDDDDSLDAILNKKLRSVEKLKNAFESIFEKYGHDLSEVADEIDMRTGRIVVDNGHLGSMNDVGEQSAWKSNKQRSADQYLGTGQSPAESTSYHFTAAEKRLCFILKTKGYRTREMLPYFPGRPLPSLQQWQCTTSRLNPIFVGALQYFAKNAVSNEFQGSRNSYLKPPSEELPIPNDTNPTMEPSDWPEEENARVTRLYYAKMKFTDMVVYFWHKSADALKEQFHWIETNRPDLVGPIEKEWSAMAKNGAKPSDALMKRIAKDMTEKSELYYDRPWTDIEDKILGSLQANDDLLFHAHDIFHRSRRSIGRRLRDMEADPRGGERRSSKADMEAPQRRRGPRKSEPMPEASAGKLRPSRSRKSEPISLLTNMEHDLSQSRNPGPTPAAVSQKRGPGRPPKLSMPSVPDSPNHSAADTAKHQASPSAGRRRKADRPPKSQQVLPAVDPGSPYENSTEFQNIHARSQERSQEHSPKQVSPPRPEAALEILMDLSQTSETSSINEAITEAQLAAMEQTADIERDIKDEEIFGLPNFSPGDLRTPKPILQDIDPEESLFVSDIDHTPSPPPAMSSSLEQAIPSQAKVKGLVAGSSPECQADGTHPGNEACPNGEVSGGLGVSPQKGVTEKKRRRKKRKSIVFRVRPRKRQEAKKSANPTNSPQSQNLERYDEMSSPPQNSSNAGQVTPSTDRGRPNIETTPQYLKVQTLKANGRPKQRLFGLSLDSSQTRQLLSGE